MGLDLVPACFRIVLLVDYDNDTLTLLVGRQEGHPACKKTEWWGVGVVICLERGADLHTARLMPLPLTVSCSVKIQIGFAFLVPALLSSPRKMSVKRVCVCVSHVLPASNCSVYVHHCTFSGVMYEVAVGRGKLSLKVGKSQGIYLAGSCRNPVACFSGDRKCLAICFGTCIFRLRPRLLPAFHFFFVLHFYVVALVACRTQAWCAALLELTCCSTCLRSGSTNVRRCGDQ